MHSTTKVTLFIQPLKSLRAFNRSNRNPALFTSRWTCSDREEAAGARRRPLTAATGCRAQDPGRPEWDAGHPTLGRHRALSPPSAPCDPRSRSSRRTQWHGQSTDIAATHSPVHRTGCRRCHRWRTTRPELADSTPRRLYAVGRKRSVPTRGLLRDGCSAMIASDRPTALSRSRPAASGRVAGSRTPS